MINKFTKESLNINTDHNEVSDIIVDKLIRKESLSLIRIGDGEISIMDANKEDGGCINFYNKHLGRVLPQKHMTEISENLKNSILNCDILGVPTSKDESLGNPYWAISKTKIAQVLNSVDYVKEKKICSMNIHYDLVKHNHLDKIMSNVKELYLITSRDVETKLKEKYKNLDKIVMYKIPGEYAYEDTKKIEEYYPTIYSKIEYDFNKSDFKGKLLLIGGGFVGKNLGVIFAKQGGVSIDLGSVFDNFVGKITRGTGKGPNKYRDPII